MNKYELKQRRQIRDSVYLYHEDLSINIHDKIIHFILSALEFVDNSEVDELIVEEAIILSAIKNPSSELKRKVFKQSGWALALADNIDLRDIKQIADQKGTNVFAVINPDILRKHVNKETAIQIATQNSISKFLNIFDTCEDCDWYEEAKTYCQKKE